MNAVPPCMIDDVGPLPVVQPASMAELTDLVQQARAQGEALFPLGGQTQLRLGLPPARPGRGVDLRALTQIIDYPARDMTITVQTGITLARLQEQLATEKQRLPIDVPSPERATLGGSLAANISGPRRLGFGTLRDYVIGITTINDAGAETKAGGRVVKNVAGYDLCKLHIGALGTLGIISQVTLKLRPLPEESALVSFGCQPTQLEGLLEALSQSRTRPVCLEVFNPAAASSVLPADITRWVRDAWLVVLGFEDNAEAVRWQTQQVIQEVTAHGIHGFDQRLGAEAGPYWQALTEFAQGQETSLTFKVNLLPRAVASFCLKAGKADPALQLQAHAGSGIVVGHLPAIRALEKLRGLVQQMHTLAAESQGNVVILACPPAWKTDLPIWGRRRPDWDLMRQVKDKLDPQRIFNPGRFIDAL